MILLDFEENSSFKELHSVLIDLSLQYKLPGVRKKLLFEEINLDQQLLVKTYGSPYVKEYHIPYLSLAEDDVDIDKFNLLKNDWPKQIKLKVPVNQIQLMIKTDSGWIINDELDLKI